MPHFLNKYRKIILAIFPFIVFLILRSVGFDGLYGQDGYEYLRYSKDLVSFIKTNELPKPFSWPVLYPISGAIIYTIIQEMGLALQLISILAWSGVTIYLHATLKLLFPKKSTSFFFIFLCFLLSPMVLRMGVVVMSDMLATCFIVMSCFYALRYGQRINTKDLYLFSFFSISSMLTRYASFIALVPFFLYVAFFLLKNKKQWIHILPLMILLGGLCIPHFYFKSETSLDFVNHGALSAWSVLSLFRTSFVSVQGELNYAFPNIIYSIGHLYHPRYLVFGVFLSIFFLQKRMFKQSNYIIISAAVFYSLFIAGVNTQNPRFLFLTFPFVLIILFPAFDFIFEKIKSEKIKWMAFVALLSLQLVLSIYSFQPIWKRNILERSIAQQIEPYQKNILYSFDIDIAMKGRNLDFKHKNLWKEEYEKFEEGALLLFHPTKFQQQWEEKNPIVNWQNLKNNYDLQVLENCSDGWKLFKIKSK